MSRAAFLRSGRPAPEAWRRQCPPHRRRASAAGAVLPTWSAGEEALREERRRIARELHDSATQLIAAAVAHVQGTEELLAGGGSPEEARARLAVAATLARESVSELRRTVCALRGAADGAAHTTALHKDEQLPEALERVVRLLTTGAPTLAIRVRIVGRWRRLPPSVEPELLRIAQEAVANVVKHSGAHRAEVRLEYSAGGAVTLRVADDGRGFDPAAARPDPERETRFGLAGMGERAALMGALLSVQSTPGRGTRLAVRVAAAP